MPTSLQNSPYFICHYGVKGRSGKEGAGLWYKNGELTEAGYRHYYGERQQQQQSNSGEKSKKIKKALAIAGAAATVAAIGFIAHKKATKLRDVMRSEAKEKARDWFYAQNKLASNARWAHEDAKLGRAAERGSGYSTSRLRELKEHNMLKDYIKRNSEQSQYYAREARKAAEKSKEFDKVSKTLTRTGAVKKYVKDKIDSRAMEKKRIAEAIEDRLKQNRNRSRIVISRNT